MTALLDSGAPLEGQLSWARVHDHNEIVNMLAEQGADRYETFHTFKNGILPCPKITDHYT